MACNREASTEAARKETETMDETLEYSPDVEREELMAQAELGRKYRAANEVLAEIVAEQQAHIIRQLESADLHSDNDAVGLVLYLPMPQEKAMYDRKQNEYWDKIRARIKEELNDGRTADE